MTLPTSPMSVFRVLTGGSGLHRAQEVCRAKQLCSRCGLSLSWPYSLLPQWSDKSLEFCEITLREISSPFLAQGTQPFPSPSMRIPGKFQCLDFHYQFQSDSQREGASVFLQHLHSCKDGYKSEVINLSPRSVHGSPRLRRDGIPKKNTQHNHRTLPC